MTERLARETLHAPVHEHMRSDFVQLHPDQTVAQALESILEKQPAGRIIYFYVADSGGRLLGTEAQQRSVPALFRRRFPWLLVTLAGGLLAAVISDLYCDVASLSLVVPFIPLVLALASSVTAQSVSLALQTLRGQRATWATMLPRVKFELATGFMLGVACGLIAAAVVFFWKRDPTAALSLLGAIVGSAACAAALGLAMPYLFRILKRNPQVAAGPIALASADAVTLLVYFNLGRWLLA
jgi:magnesium transporter